VEQTGLIVSELDLTALCFGNYARQVCGIGNNGAALWVGHQASPAQHFAEARLADLAHLVRDGDRNVELCPTSGNPINQLVAARMIRSGIESDPLAITLGED
jgi:hypothetical protein